MELVSSADFNYVIVMLLILGGVFLYDRYAEHNAVINHPHYQHSNGKIPRDWDYADVMFDNDEQIKEHLDKAKRGNGPDLNKPMLWIHVEREWNARSWRHFFERGSNDINQPYLYLTMKSIADHCGDHFNIAIIDDDSFSNLLPNWNVDMSRVGDPVKTHIRKLAIAQLLHKHGGLNVPPSTICTHSLAPMHTHGISKGRTMYLGQFPNNDQYRFGNDPQNMEQKTHTGRFKVDTAIMGCTPNSPSMLRLVKFLEMLQSADHSSEPEFLDKTNTFCNELVEHDLAHIVDGRMIGTRTKKNKVVTVHELMGSTYIDFDISSLHCIYVPHKEILAMPKYSWLAYMNVTDVLRSDTIIGKWLAKTL